MKLQNMYLAGCGLLAALAGYLSSSLCVGPKPEPVPVVDSVVIGRPVNATQTLDECVSDVVEVQGPGSLRAGLGEGSADDLAEGGDLPSAVHDVHDVQGVQDDVERFVDSVGVSSFADCDQELGTAHMDCVVDYGRAQDDRVLYERMLRYRNAEVVFHMLDHTSNVPRGQRVHGYYDVFSTDERFSPFLDDAVAALLERWDADDARELVEFYAYVRDQGDAQTARRVLVRMVEVIDQGVPRDSPYHIAGWYEILQEQEVVRYALPFASRQAVVFARLDWAREQYDAQIAFIDEQVRRAPSGDVASYDDGPSRYRPYGTNEVADPQTILENHVEWRARARTFFEQHCERIRSWAD